MAEADKGPSKWANIREIFCNEKALSLEYYAANISEHLIIRLTKRFYVAVRFFSNRSQMTAKSGKNISDTLGHRLVCRFFVLTAF